MLGGMAAPAASPTDLVVRRVRQLEPLLAALAPHEPRTTTAIVELRGLGLHPRRHRVWTVERDGELVAAAFVRHATFDRWYARALVLDPAAAPTVAALIDAGPARSLTGCGTDISPLVDHLRRRLGVYAMPWVVAPYPVSVTDRSEWDPRIRQAGRRDRRALVELYDGFELASDDTRWQVRRSLRTIMRSHRVYVAEQDGRMVGAIMAAGPTDHFVAADGLTVLPEYRSQGLGWTLAARVQRLANEHGVGATAAVAATNPMTFGEANLGRDWWMTVTLRPHRRFRGQTRLRRLYARIGRRGMRTAPVYREIDPAAPPG
jgi:N-acetylglutamate synthase-like GNAT family acetyltransferase